jgi:hypothetical protein
MAAFAGERRLKTRNTIYDLRDGVCVRARRRDQSPTGVYDAAFVGMRLVGWVSRREPNVGLTSEWTLGAYGVLWRAAKPGERGLAIAMTSTSISFEGGVGRRKPSRSLLVVRRPATTVPGIGASPPEPTDK